MSLPMIKSEPMIEEDQDDLLMSYLNSDYICSWKESNEPTYEQTSLLWEMNQGLLYPPEPDVLMTLNPVMDMLSPRSVCSSSSSDSEQPKKRRGRKKRDDQASNAHPPVIAPAPVKPLPILQPQDDTQKAITKRQERLIKNRAAALLSRKRKREHLVNLEDKCQHLTDANQGLEKRILELEKENKELKRKLDSNTSSSDHFLVMIICYIVFIVSFSSYMTGLTAKPTVKLPHDFINSHDSVSSISYFSQEEDKEETSVPKRKRFQRILFPAI